MQRQILLWGVVVLPLIANCAAEANSVDSIDDGVEALAVAATITPVLQTHDDSVSGAQKARPGRNLIGVGNASTGDLASLQYFITSVQICQDMNLSSTGFSAPQGCLELYRGPQHPVLNNAALAPAASPNAWAQANYVRSLKDAEVEGYIDLMDDASLSELQTTQQLQAAHVGSYRYGFVTWAAPIRIQAAITNLDSNSVWGTHDGNSTLVSRSGVSTLYTLADQNFASGADALTVVTLPNTSSWFKLTRPLAITAADLAAKRQIVVDLNFNPDGVVYAYTASSGTSGYLLDGPANAGPVNVIQVPSLDLAPVAHLIDQSVVKQTYVASITSGTSARFDARIELYQFAGDENRLIRGVATQAMPNAATASEPLSFPRIAYVETNADGSLNLQDWNRKTIVGGLGVGKAEGDSSTVSISCTASGSVTPLFGGCTNDQFAASFVLVKQSAGSFDDGEVEVDDETIDEDE